MGVKKTTRKGYSANSAFIKYRDGLWLEHRKRVYLYWFKLLRHAEESDNHEVDWRKYRLWGGKKEVMNSKFDEWWETHWKTCFGFEKGQSPKFAVKTRVKADGMRYALLVYENRHIGTNWDIACYLQERESRNRFPIPSLACLLTLNSKPTAAGGDTTTLNASGWKTLIAGPVTSGNAGNGTNRVMTLSPKNTRKRNVKSKVISVVICGMRSNTWISFVRVQ